MVNNDVLRGFQLLRNKAPTNSQFPIYDRPMLLIATSFPSAAIVD